MKDCSQVELLRKYISEFHNRSRTYGLHKYRTDAHKYRLQRPTHIYECPQYRYSGSSWVRLPLGNLEIYFLSNPTWERFFIYWYQNYSSQAYVPTLHHSAIIDASLLSTVWSKMTLRFTETYETAEVSMFWPDSWRFCCSVTVRSLLKRLQICVKWKRMTRFSSLLSNWVKSSSDNFNSSRTARLKAVNTRL